jgi:hypothetical protein
MPDRRRREGCCINAARWTASLIDPGSSDLATQASCGRRGSRPSRRKSIGLFTEALRLRSGQAAHPPKEISSGFSWEPNRAPALLIDRSRAREVSRAASEHVVS